MGIFRKLFVCQSDHWWQNWRRAPVVLICSFVTLSEILSLQFLSPDSHHINIFIWFGTIKIPFLKILTNPVRWMERNKRLQYAMLLNILWSVLTLFSWKQLADYSMSHVFPIVITCICSFISRIWAPPFVKVKLMYIWFIYTTIFLSFCVLEP